MIDRNIEDNLAHYLISNEITDAKKEQAAMAKEVGANTVKADQYINELQKILDEANALPLTLEKTDENKETLQRLISEKNRLVALILNSENRAIKLRDRSSDLNKLLIALEGAIESIENQLITKPPAGGYIN